MNLIMNNIISIVKFIKTRTFISRLLSINAKIWDPSKTQIFHVDIGWFLRSKVVTKVMEERGKLYIFFRNIQPDLSVLFHNKT